MRSTARRSRWRHPGWRGRREVRRPARDVVVAGDLLEFGCVAADEDWIGDETRAVGEDAHVARRGVALMMDVFTVRSRPTAMRRPMTIVAMWMKKSRQVLAACWTPVIDELGAC